MEDKTYCAICGDEIEKVDGYIHANGDCVCLACTFETELIDIANSGIFGLAYVEPTANPLGISFSESAESDEANAETAEAETAENPLDDEEIRYTDEDIAEFGEIIAEIKAHGFLNEHDFYEQCRILREGGASEEDNELLALRKKYWYMVPEPRFEGDVGNETWDAMLAQWNADTETTNA